MLVRRLLIALAVLLALTAVAAGVDTRETAPDPGPPPAAEAGEAGEAGAPDTVTRRLEADAAQPARIRARLGDTVVLTVSGTEPDSVEIEGIGKIEALDDQSPARIELYADTVGEYPITMLQAERRIGTLTIE